jgi:hypothetical protein
MFNKFKKSFIPPSPTSKINSTKLLNAKKYIFNHIFAGTRKEKNFIQRICPQVKETNQPLTQIDQ